MKTATRQRRSEYVRALALSSLVTSIGLQAADPVEPPKPKWETSAGVTATLSAGNSESIMFGGNVVTGLKTPKYEIRMEADAGYGKAKPGGDPDADMEKNSDYIRGNAQYNRLVSERLFWYGRVSAIHDDIADLSYRLTLSPGIGYYFIKDAKMSLSAEVGPGYVFEETSYYLYDPVAVPPRDEVVHDKNDYATLRISERFEYKISDTARLWQTAEYLPEVTRWADNFILNFEVGLGAAITKKLELRVVATDTYDPEPARGRKENDFKLMAGLNYKF